MCRKYNFKASIFLLILLFPLLAIAQSGMEDVIYFKNGGILRGEIIERMDDESLKIKTAGRNVIVVMLEDVTEIKREKIPAPQYFKESGYVNHTGIAILPGQGSTSVRYQMIHGYQFTAKFSAGLGTGLTTYSDPLNLVPFFLNVKYKFLKANSTPFVFLKSGYSFSILSDPDEEDLPVERHSGGFMLNSGIGLQFETGAGYGLCFTIGFNTDHSDFEQERWDDRIIENDISYRRISLGFGLSF